MDRGVGAVVRKRLTWSAPAVSPSIAEERRHAGCSALRHPVPQWSAQFDPNQLDVALPILSDVVIKAVVHQRGAYIYQ
jgi:hypothetical protein